MNNIRTVKFFEANFDVIDFLSLIAYIEGEPAPEGHEATVEEQKKEIVERLRVMVKLETEGWDVK